MPKAIRNLKRLRVYGGQRRGVMRTFLGARGNDRYINHRLTRDLSSDVADI